MRSRADLGDDVMRQTCLYRTRYSGIPPRPTRVRSGMWIVRVALRRPYTFVVLALLILILSPVVILRTPTDIFPNVDIPVIAVAFAYTGLNPEEMEGRITTVFERFVTTVTNDVEHIESTAINGQAIVRLFLQPGTQPPVLIISASTVPMLQLALSGQGLAEQQLNDIGLNFLRTQFHGPGVVISVG